MRPVIRTLCLLALASASILAFRVIEESATFHAKFPAPPGWNAIQSRVRQRHDGPGSGWAIHVNGAAFQRPPLIHGGGRDIRIQLLYRAPRGGAWLALRGDPTPKTIREFTLIPMSGLKAPVDVEQGGLYRIPLPPAAAWTYAAILVKQRTSDLPYLTLFLGGPQRGDPVGYSSVRMRYPGSEDDLLSNGDFVEQWPAWAVHPEWLNQGWAPARFILILLVASVLAVIIIRRRSGGYAPTYLLGAIWLFLSSLMVMGAGAFPDLARVVFPSDSERLWFEAAFNLCLLIDMALFVLAGWVGGQVLGARARFAGLLIPLLAALAMTATAATDSNGGLLPPAVSYDQFTSGFGVAWLTIGAAAVWWGVRWGSQGQGKKRSPYA